MYELMCTFFFNCHTYTLASELQLEQPSWLNDSGQFSQKKVWLRLEIIEGFVGVNGGMNIGVSVTLSNGYKHNLVNFASKSFENFFTCT